MGERTEEEERLAYVGQVAAEGVTTEFWLIMHDMLESQIGKVEHRIVTGGLSHEEYLDDCRTLLVLRKMLRLPADLVDAYRQLLASEGIYQ